MDLTEHQVTYIYQDVLQRGIKDEELAESMTDHLCCCIENDNNVDFMDAYQNAIQAFGAKGMMQIQKETTFLLNTKYIFMRKTMFLLGYFAAILTTSGITFKLMHWPGASIMLLLGILLLNFGFLPMFFMDRYKKSLV